MKKIFLLMFAFVVGILCVSCSTSEINEAKKFKKIKTTIDAKTIEKFSYSADTWFEDNFTIAAFAICSHLDFDDHHNEELKTDIENTYVAINEKNNTVSAITNILNKTGTFSVVKFNSDKKKTVKGVIESDLPIKDYMELLLQIGEISEYKQVDDREYLNILKEVYYRQK